MPPAVRIYATLKNISLFSCHQHAAGFYGHHTRYGMAAQFRDHFKASIDKPRCSRLNANPKHARVIALQGKHASAFESIDAESLCAPSVEFCQTRFSTKIHGAVAPLGDGMHAIRWQAVKECDRAPLVQARNWRRRWRG